MANARIDRTDDTAQTIKIIATVADTEDALTKQWQGVYIADGTTPAANKLAITAAGEGKTQPAGNVAHDAADSGNPIKIGMKVVELLPTTVLAEGDRADSIADNHGRIITRLNAPRNRVVQSAAIILTTTAETSLIAAGAAGVFRDISYLLLSNTSGTGTRLDFRDATASTIRFSVFLAASGGGAVIQPPSPITQAAAANAWTVQMSNAVSDVRVFAQAIETK